MKNQKGICKGCNARQHEYGTRQCECGEKDPLGTGHKP